MILLLLTVFAIIGMIICFARKKTRVDFKVVPSIIFLMTPIEWLSKIMFIPNMIYYSEDGEVFFTAFALAAHVVMGLMTVFIFLPPYLKYITKCKDYATSNKKSTRLVRILTAACGPYCLQGWNSGFFMPRADFDQKIEAYDHLSLRMHLLSYPFTISQWFVSIVVLGIVSPARDMFGIAIWSFIHNSALMFLLGQQFLKRYLAHRRKTGQYSKLQGKKIKGREAKESEPAPKEDLEKSKSKGVDDKKDDKPLPKSLEAGKGKQAKDEAPMKAE